MTDKEVDVEARVKQRDFDGERNHQIEFTIYRRPESRSCGSVSIVITSTIEGVPSCATCFS